MIIVESFTAPSSTLHLKSTYNIFNPIQFTKAPFSTFLTLYFNLISFVFSPAKASEQIVLILSDNLIVSTFFKFLNKPFDICFIYFDSK